MSKSNQNLCVQYEEGKEEDYVQKVCVFMETEAVRPASCKMRSINVKPITINCFNYYLLPWYPLDSLCSCRHVVLHAYKNKSKVSR